MTKKHRHTTGGENISALVKDIASSFKNDYIGTFSGKNRLQLVESWIPSSNVAMNCVIGDPRLGAFPQGKIIELFGPKSSAKSLIIYDAGAQCQKLGGVFVLLDSETAYHEGFCKRLGVNPKTMLYGQLRGLEEGIDFIRDAIVKIREINSSCPIVIGWDSLAASTPEKELDIDMVDAKQAVATSARILSRSLRSLNSLVARNSVALIVANQIRKKIGVMYGKKETTTGGEALPFYASVRIEVRRTKKLKDGNRIIGHKVHLYCEKNKVRPPFGQCDIDIIIDRKKRLYGIKPWSGLVATLVENEILLKKKKSVVLAANSEITFTPKQIPEFWEHIKPYVEIDPYAEPDSNEEVETTEEDEDTSGDE